MLGAAVKIDLAAGAAGAGAVLPEIVLLAEAHHVGRVDPHFLCPNIVGLVVVLIHRDVQKLGGNLQHLRQEFPRPCGSLALEIILKAEVAQHFKERAVTRRDAHALNVRRADAFLAGGDTVARRLLLAEEPFFHRRHAGVDQQKAVIVVGHQGKAVQTKVSFAFKERKVFFAQLVQAGPFHRVHSPHKINVIFVLPCKKI